MKILMVVYDNDSYIVWFPQGLAYLVPTARDAGHEISVYQQDIYHCPDCHLMEYLDNHDFDIVEDEIQFLKQEFNIKFITFSDELLMRPKSCNLEQCLVFIDANLGVKLDCNKRLNFVDTKQVIVISDFRLVTGQF